MPKRLATAQPTTQVCTPQVWPWHLYPPTMAWFISQWWYFNRWKWRVILPTTLSAGNIVHSVPLTTFSVTWCYEVQPGVCCFSLLAELNWPSTPALRLKRNRTKDSQHAFPDWKSFFAARTDNKTGNKNTSVFTEAWLPDKNDKVKKYARRYLYLTF